MIALYKHGLPYLAIPLFLFWWPPATPVQKCLICFCFIKGFEGPRKTISKYQKLPFLGTKIERNVWMTLGGCAFMHIPWCFGLVWQIQQMWDLIMGIIIVTLLLSERREELLEAVAVEEQTHCLQWLKFHSLLKILGDAVTILLFMFLPRFSLIISGCLFSSLFLPHL